MSSQLAARLLVKDSTRYLHLESESKSHDEKRRRASSKDGPAVVGLMAVNRARFIVPKGSTFKCPVEGLGMDLLTSKDYSGVPRSAPGAHVTMAIIKCFQAEFTLPATELVIQ